RTAEEADDELAFAFGVREAPAAAEKALVVRARDTALGRVPVERMHLERRAKRVHGAARRTGGLRISRGRGVRTARLAVVPRRCASSARQAPEKVRTLTHRRVRTALENEPRRELASDRRQDQRGR